MRAVLATLAFAVLAAATPQASGTSSTAHAVVSDVAPAQSPPPGCSPNYEGSFLVGPVNVTKIDQRDVALPNTTELGITLKNGILTDPQGRTGYVASNQQFQFDDPPQAGAIWTDGFTVCQNGSLALGSRAVWYKCLSGSFYNLYFHNELDAGQCILSYIVTRPQGNSGGPAPVPSSLSTEIFSTSMPASSSSSGATNTASMSSGGSGGGSGTTTGGGSNNTPGSQGSNSGSGSQSSSEGAADAVDFKGEMGWLAAGLFAFAAMF